MKKFLFIFSFLFLFFLTSCSNGLTQLGSSSLYLELPEGYKMTDDDFDEDQVAYYYKDDESVDFDVYQWDKNKEYTLESEAEYFAELFDTEAKALTINDIQCMKYISLEEYDGYTYSVINYMFDDGTYIVEVCFWTINTTEELNFVNNVINTITLK